MSMQKKYIYSAFVAANSINPGSDIDLAVIVSDENPVDRSYRLFVVGRIEDMLLNQVGLNIPYDIVFFNQTDFERNKTVSVSVAKGIIQEGELLYER